MFCVSGSARLGASRAIGASAPVVKAIALVLGVSIVAGPDPPAPPCSTYACSATDRNRLCSESSRSLLVRTVRIIGLASVRGVIAVPTPICAPLFRSLHALDDRVGEPGQHLALLARRVPSFPRASRTHDLAHEVRGSPTGELRLMPCVRSESDSSPVEPAPDPRSVGGPGDSDFHLTMGTMCATIETRPTYIDSNGFLL
jgi:hypothetical protein